MKNKIIFVMIGILLISFISAEVCCQKRASDGALCVEEDSEAKCDLTGDLGAAPTTCGNTDYCDIGCCINTIEGSCTPSSSKAVCEENKGTWKDSATCSYPQCTKGCCQVAGGLNYFKTPTECNRLASLSGRETTFDSSITDYFQCILLSSSGVKGACVYRGTATDVTRPDCKIKTSEECRKEGGEFSAGLLCTASELETKCVATTNTICSEDPKDDKVYFIDSCNNLANVYDSDKYGVTEYWETIINPELACNLEEDGAETCGNCDYPASVCKADRRSDAVNPVYGDFFCSNLNCEYKGNTYVNGEKFCAVDSVEGGIIITDDFKNFTDKTNSEIMEYLTESNLPGTEYLVLECNEGEIVPNRCDSLKQAYCIEWEISDGVKHAMCAKNTWEQCIFQTKKGDCEEAGECVWITPDFFNILGLQKGSNWYEITDYPMNVYNESEGTCVPKFAPGYNFWGEALSPVDITSNENVTGMQQMCSLASDTCVVQRDFAGNAHVNPSCEPGFWNIGEGNFNDWAKERMQFCGMMGDCGVKNNYLGLAGGNVLGIKTSNFGGAGAQEIGGNLGNVLYWTNYTENLKGAQEEAENLGEESE